MDDVRQWLQAHVPLTDEAWAALTAKLHALDLRKNAAFQKAHQPAEQLAFLRTGALYARYADDSRKHRIAFFCLPTVNRIVCDLEAFAGGTRSRMSIVASEASTLLVVNRQDLYRLYDEHPCLERLGRKLAEYSYARAMERIGRMELKNVERAADLHHRYREVFHTFTNIQIAEYLGMSDGELSRAKRRFNGHK